MTTATVLACPECGSSIDLNTIERITGHAGVIRMTRDHNGTHIIDWTGDTEMNWESSTTVGLSCSECGWEHVGTAEDPGYALLAEVAS